MLSKAKCGHEVTLIAHCSPYPRYPPSSQAAYHTYNRLIDRSAAGDDRKTRIFRGEKKKEQENKRIRTTINYERTSLRKGREGTPHSRSEDVRDEEHRL